MNQWKVIEKDWSKNPSSVNLAALQVPLAHFKQKN
jgi:hypothetical protein